MQLAAAASSAWRTRSTAGTRALRRPTDHTLRQLLDQTSGLDDYVTDKRFLAAERRRGPEYEWAPRQLVALGSEDQIDRDATTVAILADLAGLASDGYAAPRAAGWAAA